MRRHIVLFAGTALLLVYFLRLDPHELVTDISGFDPVCAVAVVLLNLVPGFLKTARWRYFLRKSGIRNAYSRDYLAVNAGFFLGIVTPGTAGELTRVLYLGDRSSRGMSIITFEKLSDMGVLIFLAGAAVLTQTLALLYSVVGVSLLALSILLGYWLLTRHDRLVTRPMKFLARLMLSPSRYRSLQLIYWDYHSMASDWSSMVRSFLYSMALWVLPLVQMLLIHRGISLDLPVRMVAFTYFVPYLAGILSLIPLGLGVFELGLQGLSVSWGAGSAADTIPVFYRIFVTLPIILFGYACQVFFSWGEGKKGTSTSGAANRSAEGREHGPG